MTTFATIEKDVRAGLFSRALGCLLERKELRHLDTALFDVLHAELLYQTGDIVRASNLSRTLLKEELSPECAARAAYVGAVSAFESSQFAASLELIWKSLKFAEVSGVPDLLANAQLGLFRLLSDTGTAVPLLRDVRKVIARTGNPHLMVGLRLHFARVEASRHSPLESKRHLDAAHDLLETFPNVWLEGRVHLGWSIVSTLSGDLLSAANEAKLAIQCASQSGHARTKL